MDLLGGGNKIGFACILSMGWEKSGRVSVEGRWDERREYGRHLALGGHLGHNVET